MCVGLFGPTLLYDIDDFLRPNITFKIRIYLYQYRNKTQRAKSSILPLLYNIVDQLKKNIDPYMSYKKGAPIMFARK